MYTSNIDHDYYVHGDTPSYFDCIYYNIDS